MKTEPSMEGLLTDAQLLQLGRIKAGLWAIKDAIERVNALAAESGLPLRPVFDYPLSLMSNDISQLAFSHGLAEDRIKAAAFAAVGSENLTNNEGEGRPFTRTRPERVAA